MKDWDPKINDANHLRKRHHEDNLTLRELAVELNCSRYKVTSQFKKFNIPYKTSRHIPTESFEKLNDIEWIKSQHESGLSITEIARSLGVQYHAVNTRFKKYNLNKNKVVKTIFPSLKSPKKTLKKLHHDERKSLTEIAQIYNVNIATISLWFKRLNIEVRNTFSSIEQTQVKEYIESLGFLVIENDTSLIFPKEIDLYIPEKNLAIEYNGIFWHSSQHIHKKYHQEKTIECRNRNIDLLHIFSNEWINKEEIWKSMISSRLGKSRNIGARKCKIAKISNDMARRFYDDNHLYGYVQSKVHLGLFHNNELVSMMSFTKSRFNHKIDYELTRYANKRFCRVIGGAGKLLNYFIIQWKPESIITYADMRYSQGNLYIKLGFNFDGITEPNYGYVIDGKIQSRQKYQKHKLEKKLEFFDSNLTEEQNMKLHDYYRIYDCGNMTFKMTI